MAERIIIAELDIDDTALLKSTKELKKEIDSLKDSQKELRKSGNTASAEFVKNEAALKSLGKEYRNNQKALTQRVKVTQDAAVREELLTSVLDKEVTSITAANEQTKILTQLRNDTNSDTKEGAELVDKLNKQLNRNTAFVKDQADSYLKSKINIGNYKESILEAFEEMEASKKVLEEEKNALEELRNETEEGSDAWNFYNQEISQTNIQINVLSGSMVEVNDQANATSATSQILSGDFKGLADNAKAAGGAGILLKSALKGVVTGLKGVIKSSLAFLATPIGLVVAAIGVAFLLVKNAMNRSEEATQKLTRIFAAFGGIANKVLKVLEPLGTFLIDVIVFSFEQAGKAADDTIKLISSGLSLLGFDKAAKSVNSFSDSIKTAAKEAQALADAEAKLEKAQRTSQRLQLDYQNQAEKLRQIRDDTSKSDKERFEANEKIGIVLKKQLEEETKIAQLALFVANQRIKAEGETKENLDAQAEALTTIVDIQERIVGQESEQLTNINSLRKEAADKAKAIRDKATEDTIKNSRLEIDLFIAQQGFKKRSYEEEYVLNKKILDKELEDLKLRHEKGKLSVLEYEVAKLKLANDFGLKNSDILVKNAEEEIKVFTEKNDEILNKAGELDQKTFDNKTKALASKLKAETDYNNKRLEAGVVSEEEYNSEIALINEENRRAQAELKIEFEKGETEKERERKLANIELRREAEILTNEQDLALQLERLELEKQNELEAAEKTGLSKELILKKFAKSEKKIRESVEASKLNAISAGLSGAKSLFKENTVAYKALAIAEATINTYKAASLALSTYAYPLGGIFAGIAVAQGLGQVAQISGVKFAKGGISEIEGASHAQGGVPIYAGNQYIGEAEGGEGIGILNKSAFGDFMGYNNSFLSGKSNNGKFQGGGIITQAVNPSTSPVDIVQGVAEAIQGLNIQVAVEDINTGQSSFAEVVNNADI